jgi:hypothetical protein
MTTARAFWTIAPGVGEMRTETLGEDGVLVRTLASGISRGTEAIVFAGRVPPSQYAAMRAPMMAGAFPFPVKYGYSAVGVTEEGARVFVLHPHQDRFRAPPVLCIPVPDAVPTARAVLAANMETAVNIAWDAAALPGERIMVVGAGVVGLLAAALLARLPAARVTLVDPDAARVLPARRLGCNCVAPEVAPGDQELIVHASGTEAGLRLALDRAAFEGRIIEASWFADQAPALPIGEAFHARRLRIIASQVGTISPPMRGRRTHAERLALALDLLADPAFEALLEPPSDFAALPRDMPRLLASGLCHVVRYGAGD